MPAFSPLNNLSENLSDSEGIVKLWAESNLLKSDWKLDGSFGGDIYYYFFIPSDFIIQNNKVYYNNSYKYIKRPIEVYHNGIRYSEEIWVMEESSLTECNILTDDRTKLPYVIKPSLGRYNFQTERCYFIPVGGMR